jgi:hypothetical protein
MKIQIVPPEGTHGFQRIVGREQHRQASRDGCRSGSHGFEEAASAHS